MASEIVVSDLPEFDLGLEAMMARVDVASRQFVLRGAEEIKTEAQAQFTGNSSNAWHSDAWPIPTRWTGNLESSIYMDNVKSLGKGVWQSETGPHTVYGRRVELGYHGSGHWPYYTTRAFPYMEPGIKRATPKLDKLFNDTVLAAQEA